MRIGLLCFTKNGGLIVEKLIQIKGIEFIHYNQEQHHVKEFVRECFSLDGIIFVGAVGIGVRLIAPFIQSKAVDPAVVVIDEQGRYIISILSGHIGGANELALRLASELEAIPIITTATDLNGIFAVDVWSKKSNCTIADIKNIKHVSSALLRGDEVGLCSEFNCTGDLPNGISTRSNAKIGILVSTSQTKQPFEITLHVIPKIVTLGVGCKKGTDPKAFEQYLLATLEEQDISLKSVKLIASIDLKKEENCIRLFCEKYKVEFRTYSATELSNAKGEFTSSAFVKRTTGVDNVCERSAVIGSGGALRLKKQSKDGMTIAIANEKWRCKF